MKRFLSFMLGLIFGIVFLLGTFGLAVYSSVTVVHPNEIYTDIEKYLGDLGDVSLLQAYYNILDLYQNKTGGLTNEKLYSVGDFLADNHISSTNENGQTVAFGIVMPKELLDAPLFEYFNTNVDSNGHTGIQRALKQIKLSAVPAIVNTFATPGEDGTPIVSDEVVAQLDNHSVYNLVYGYDDQTDSEGVNIVSNLARVLENITLSDLIPAFRPSEDGTDNIMKNLLFAVGQAPIGKLIIDLTGDQNLLGVLNEDGSLAEVGKLTIADILGDGDPLISSLLGNVCISDFISDEGEFAIMEAMEQISIAGLFSLVKRPVDMQIDETNVTSYYETKADNSRGPLIWSVGNVSGKYYISLNAENDSVATTWYEGQLVCLDTEHTHQANCFDYLWYMPCKTEHDHTDEYTVNVNGIATAYAPISTASLHYTIAGLKLSSLFDDTGAINLDNLIAKFDEHSLDAIIKELLADNEVLNKLSTLLELDGMTLSQLLADGGFDTLLSKVTDAPISHILNTFGVTGMDFVTNIVGDMSINQLISGGFTDISIASLLGLVKRETTITDGNGNLLPDVVVRNFTTIQEDTTVVELSVAKQVVGENTYYNLSTNYDAEADKLAEDYVAPIWYEGQLKCENAEHTTLESHDKSCFAYVLYQACANEDAGHNHATEDAFFKTVTNADDTTTTTYYVATNKLYNVLGNMTIGSIIEGGFDTLFAELTSIKLSELFEILGMGKLEGVLDTLGQFTIQELIDGGYNNLALGSLLGYKRYQNVGAITDGSVVTYKDGENNVVGYVANVGEQMVLSTDGSKWYNGKLACTEEHKHNIDCYEYLWYTACSDTCAETHDHVTIEDKPHTLATGIFSILVDLTLGDITNNPNSLMDKVFEIKLGDLFDEELDGLMATIAKFSIKDLMDPSTLNGIGLGDVLNYVRKDVTEQITTANGWDTDLVSDGGKVIVKYNSTTDEYTYFDVDDEKWYNGQMHCSKEVHAHAEPDCGTADSWICEKEEHTHDIDCYGYVWYAECNSTPCSEHDDHFTLDGKTYGSVSGLYGVLADLTIGSLTGGDDIMTTLTNRLTLGDIFGDHIPEMLKSLKDTPISQLAGAIETTKVGDLLGYTYNQEASRWEKDGTPLTGIEKVLADETITNLKDFSSILDKVTLGDVLDPMPDMLQSLADTKIPDLGDKLETLKVGDFLSYKTNEVTYEVEKVENGWIDTTVEGIKQDTNETFAKSETTIVDGATITKWYEAQLNCKDSHLHDASCYGYVWYEKCEVADCTTHKKELYIDVNGTMTKCGRVEGISGKLADKSINDLKDFNSIMNELTLGDVLDPVPDMLSKLTDTPITQLGDKIDTLVVGDFLGYGHLSVDVESDGWSEVISINGLYQHTDGSFAKVSDAIYYVAELTCNDEVHQHSNECGTVGGWTCGKDEHAHTAECYGYKWYTKCKDECTGADHSGSIHIADLQGKYFVPVTGITSKLAGKTINELSNLTDLMNDLTLNDVFGEGKVPGMLDSIADEKIANLESALNKIYVGEFLGYHPGDKILLCEIDDDPSHIHVEDMGDANCCYEKKLACKDQVHTHSAMCYIECYEWWQLTCEDYTHDHDFAVARDTCYTKVTGITGKIANERLDTLSDIGETIKTFTLSDVMGDDVPGMLKGIANTPIGQLDTALDGLYLGEILEYTKHTADDATLVDCTTTVVTDASGSPVVKTNATNSAYVMLVDGVWYDAVVSCATEGCSHTTIDCYGYVWYDNGSPAMGITAKLANEKVSQLGNLGDTIQTYSLHDVLGDSVPEMLDSIKYEPINNLNNSINNIYVGDFLGYTKNGENGTTTLDCQVTEHTSTDHTQECYYDNYNWLNGSTPVDGMMAKIANKKVGNLGSLGNDIETFTFAEIMGKKESDNAIIKELYDTQVGNIGSKMDTMMLGTAMGYYRNVVCAEGNHTHTDGDVCYEKDVNGKTLWYKESTYTTLVTAPQSAFVNSTLQNVGDDIADIKMGELITINDESSSMLKALKDTPINDISSAIDGMALGTSMGFERNLTCTETHSHDAGCYESDADGKNVWYECKDTTEGHTHVAIGQTESCYTKVTGLNAKMSNLTIGNMSGQALVDIVTSLTMGDMIDSEILVFSPEDEYKLSILYCQNAGHTHSTATIPTPTPPYSKPCACTLTEFIVYSSTNSTDSTTAQAFYEACHTSFGTLNDSNTDYVNHRDAWKQQTFSSFISTLMDSIG